MCAECGVLYVRAAKTRVPWVRESWGWRDFWASEADAGEGSRWLGMGWRRGWVMGEKGVLWCWRTGKEMG